MNPRELLSRIFRARFALLAAFVLPIMAAVGIFLLMPPTYTAAAKLLVRVGRELQSTTQMALQSSNNQAQSTLAEFVTAELEILKSRELAQRVVGELDPRGLCAGRTTPERLSPDQLDLQSDAFLQSVNAQQIKGASIIEVTYTSCTPAVAEKVLSRYLELYQQKHIEAYAQGMVGFIDGQVSRLEEDLKGIEQKVSDYKVSKGLFDPADERQVALTGRDALTKSLGEARTSLSQLRQRLNEGKRLLASTPEMYQLSTQSEPSAVYTKARTDLVELQLQLQQKIAAYEPDSVTLQGLQGQIAALKQLVQEEGRQPQVHQNVGRNPVWDELNGDMIRTQTELGATEAKIEAAQAESVRLDERLRQIEELAPPLESMLRERDGIRDSLKIYRERQRQATIDEDLDREKIVDARIIENVFANPKRTSPRAGKFILTGLGAGAGCFVVLLAAVVGLGRSYATAESVENTLGLPVLVSIPKKSGLMTSS